MDMNRMIALTNTLRERVQSYGDELRRSEVLTRYALIDPLLRELGWNTEDPGIVTPEYSVDIYNGGTARADYALTHNGNPLMLVEAKKLGEPLLYGNAVEQGIRGCINTATDFFVVTDGQKWEIYDTRKRVPPPEMKVVEFDFITDSPWQFCSKALSIYRDGALEGYVETAPTLDIGGGATTGLIEQSGVVTTPATPATTLAPSGPPPGTMLIPATMPAPTTPPPTTTPVPATGEIWHPLSEFEYQGDILPEEIMFPDNSRVVSMNWSQTQREIVRWLTGDGRRLSLPIRQGTRNLVAATPTHPSGRPFHGANSEVNGVHVDTNFTGKDMIRNIRIIIGHAGQDAAQFKLRLRPYDRVRQ